MSDVKQLLEEADAPFVVQRIEETTDVRVKSRSPVNASPAKLPASTHHSGRLWLAMPSTFRTFVYGTAPV
jgi:hypothetical protein